MTTSKAEANSVDPVTFAVFAGALDAIIREMTITMRRAAMSPVLAIGNDFSNCIADGTARMIAQGEDQPVHLGAMIYATKAVAKYFGDDLAPGDIIFHNDPRTGGSHLQDMTLYKPVFYENELLFWSVNRSHMNETGGPVAGGYNPLAEEIWAEGVRISPLKIYEGGKPRRDVIDMLMTNFRIRRLMRGDLGAQIAACTLAERRLIALLKKYGKEQVKQAQSLLLDRAEQMMRDEIRQMPDGEYFGSAIVEDNERGSGDLEIRCTIRIQGDEMFVKIQAPPSVNSYINSYGANSISGVYMGLLHFVNPGVPHNEGLYRPIHVDLGEPGTIVNAREPAACGLTTNTPAENIGDAVRAALAQAMPERAGGAWAHHCINSLFGTDPRHGAPYAYYAHLSGWGGGGAYWGMDGEPCIGSLTAAGAAMTGDIEVVEHSVPIHVRRYELDPDSGCPGRWRGGLGPVFEFQVVDHDALMTQFGDGMKFAPQSVLGADSPHNRERVYRKAILRGAEGTPERLPLHAVRTVKAGERVLIHEPGGGGVGPAFEREPQAVASDVRNGFVTLERARSEYGVAVDPTTFAVDEQATAELRSRANNSSE
ncbi:MAG TPA: hydantoinase B/oxoprolinase family protein [Anaerolineae bacterium]|nr:hydantoinase B/oxoprolinase family protein [Anaerolineae bacterium]